MRTGAARSARPRRKVPENALPGDPNWGIRHLGPPDAIMGYAGQASVLAGPPIPLFVSTTSRSFRVLANLLRAFADGPAAARFPARDNLTSTHEWPGDPIAARHDLW